MYNSLFRFAKSTQSTVYFLSLVPIYQQEKTGTGLLLVEDFNMDDTPKRFGLLTSRTLDLVRLLNKNMPIWCCLNTLKFLFLKTLDYKLNSFFGSNFA